MVGGWVISWARSAPANTLTCRHHPPPPQLVNKRLPGWSDPPSRPAILAALKTFDVDHNGTLDRKEFQAVGGRGSPPL